MYVIDEPGNHHHQEIIVVNLSNEISLTRENLVNFANEINIDIDFQIVNLDVLSLPFRVSDKEAIVVNLSPKPSYLRPSVLFKPSRVT